MSKLIMEVDPCTSIDVAADEAQAIADMVKATVQFDFNSVRCMAVPGGRAHKLAELYHEKLGEIPTVFSDD